jgi:hypothetical protein
MSTGLLYHAFGIRGYKVEEDTPLCFTHGDKLLQWGHDEGVVEELAA